MQPARAAQEHPFTVSYDGSGLSFVDPRPIELGEGDVLLLHFQGDLDGMIPGVTFSRNGDDLDCPLGPFQDALQTAGFVVLRGNSGLADQFQCKALLSPKMRGDQPPLSSSNELDIGNGQAARPAKEIRVLVRPKAGSAEPVDVTVDLEEVTVYAPDPVVWNFVFENLDPRDYEPVLYLDVDQTPIESGPFGPFQSLSMAGLSEPLGVSTTLAYRLITSGNNYVRGQYHFNVGVRPTREGPSNAILSVVDPIIDNSGPPHH